MPYARLPTEHASYGWFFQKSLRQKCDTSVLTPTLVTSPNRIWHRARNPKSSAAPLAAMQEAASKLLVVLGFCNMVK